MQNWNKIEFIFAHKLHIDPFCLRKLEYYSIVNLIKEYQEYVDQENKQYEKQQKEIDKTYKPQSFNTNSFKVPDFKMPNIPTPKI